MAQFVGKIILSPLNYLCTFVKIIGLCLYVSISALYSILDMHMSILLQRLHQFFFLGRSLAGAVEGRSEVETHVVERE